MMDRNVECFAGNHLCEDCYIEGAANQEFFPDLQNGLVLFSACYQAEPEAIAGFQRKGIQLPCALLEARGKRQAEYLAGRYCAMEGLKSLGSDQLTVGSAKDRSPVWPEGYIGSISHSNGLALAVVGRQKQFRAVGVDAEEIVMVARAERLSKAVLLPEDLKLKDARDLPLDWFFTLVFSAKESLFKLLYPEVGHFFGFDAAVMNALDTSNQTFTMMLTKGLAERFPAKSLYQGQYIMMGHCLVTLIYLEQGEALLSC